MGSSTLRVSWTWTPRSPVCTFARCTLHTLLDCWAIQQRMETQRISTPNEDPKGHHSTGGHSKDLDEHLSASNKPSALVSMKLSELGILRGSDVRKFSGSPPPHRTALGRTIGGGHPHSSRRNGRGRALPERKSLGMFFFQRFPERSWTISAEAEPSRLEPYYQKSDTSTKRIQKGGSPGQYGFLAWKRLENSLAAAG